MGIEYDYNIQSAFMMPTDAKERQESASLLNIDDSFKKIIIVKDHIKPKRGGNSLDWIDGFPAQPRFVGLVGGGGFVAKIKNFLQKKIAEQNCNY